MSRFVVDTGIENSRFTREHMSDFADNLLAEEGVVAAKFAVAALILDESNNVLACHHSARDGEFGKSAVGSVTETVRYLEDDDSVTETPVEALTRCFKEEHAIERESLPEVGLSYVGNNPVFKGEWPVGTLRGILSTYPSTNILLRAENPDVFNRVSPQVSREIESNSFVSFEKAARLTPFRPGYREWLQIMKQHIDKYGGETADKVVWPKTLPKTGKSARYPYV